MKYIIMCGGVYSNFETPKQLSVVNGEVLVERTIRLLKEEGITDINISSNNEIFEKYAPVLYHNNSYKYEDGKVSGYWVDAYYPTDEQVVYLHGDVYYSKEAIHKIVDYVASENTFIGNEVARNKAHNNWGEPFGYIVVDQKKFRKGIEEVKKLQDEGKLERGYALSWELYRVLNGLNPNKMFIYDTTYLSINDFTDDIDAPFRIEEMNKKLRIK